MKNLLILLSLVGVLMSYFLYADDYVMWSGGVSTEERAQAPATGTKIAFFEEGGPYLADIFVTVTAANGTQLVSTNCPGPWIILNLPEGKFKITAKRQSGEEQGVRIDTSTGVKEYALMFARANPKLHPAWE